MSIDRKSIPTFVYYSLSFYTVRYIVLKSFNIRISNDLLELMIYDKTFFNDHGKIV